MTKQARNPKLKTRKKYEIQLGTSAVLTSEPWALGMDGPEASRRLLETGKIAATPMINWGGSASKNYVRIVFSNEPAERLRGIGQRFRDALT